MISSIIIIISAIVTILGITYRGYYPWGPDAWGHLFKSKVLYDSVSNGSPYPLYTDLWYNGVPPFRYWAPLCYYLILLFELMTKGNVITAYYLFMGLIFMVGAFGWILWGKKTGRLKLGIILALMWFFLPDNLSIFIAAGNLPRVTANTVFPYLFFSFWTYMEKRSKGSLFGIYLCMLLITLSHLMIAAMAGIAMFIYVMWYCYTNKKLVQGCEIIGIAILGIVSAGVWFYPALKGGMLAMNQEAVLEFTKMLTYPITESLNPFFRDKNIEGFYFGISIFVVDVIGLIFGNKKSRIGFGVTLIIFLGTTKAFLPFTSKMPMSQMFWMMRFTPLAMASFFTGIFLWTKLKKKFLIIFIGFIIIDCAWGFKAIGHGNPLSEIKGDLDQAITISNQKIAMLDLSEFGSYPSYYISYNDENKKIGQVYGWAFQGAETSPNIISINSAIETEWYSYVLDRSLELGADTLVVKKNDIKDEEKFFDAASKVGYEKESESEFSWILKYPVDHSFGTKAEYTGFGIGKYAVNISYMFPQFEIGKSDYIDDYSESYLSKYKVIYLSGFEFKNRDKAEEIIKNISQKGTKVIIDLTGADTSVYSSRSEFLEVRAQPVKFNNNFPSLNINNESFDFPEIPEEYHDWNTNYLENLDTVEGKSIFKDQIINFLGTKINDNIHFIGFNIPFYALETNDDRAIKILENLTDMNVGDVPERKIVNVKTENRKNQIFIESDEKNTIIPIANLDAFAYTQGSSTRVNNLILSNDKELDIKITYPYFIQGTLITVFGLIMLILSYKFYFKKLFKACQGGDTSVK